VPLLVCYLNSGYVYEDLLREKQRKTKHISPYGCIKMREKTLVPGPGNVSRIGGY